MIWVIVFVLSVGVETFFFMLQRAALEIGRLGGIDDVTSRHLLPLWYSMVWPVKIIKWISIWFMFMGYGFTVGIICVVFPLILHVKVPVPHSAFKPIFGREIERLMGEKPDLAAKFWVACQKI